MAGAAGVPTGCEIDLQQSGVLDLDIRSVRVQGTVTLNGVAFPVGSSRGQLVFRETELGFGLPVPLDALESNAFDVHVPPGTYDVEYAGDPSLCSDTEASDVPCNAGVVRAGIEIAADGVLDVDVPAVTVQGAVSVNGTALPASPSGHGRIELVRAAAGTEAGAAASRTFGDSTPATYTMTVLPGTYSVVWAGNPEACEDAAPAPCNRREVQSNVSIAASGVLDVDVPAATLQGAVTVNGAPMPALTGERGALAFSSADGGSVETGSLGTGGAAAYAITLVRGSYDVSWSGRSAACSDGAPGVPCNHAIVRSGVSVTEGGVLDVDVRAVNVQGSVTVNAAPMPSASAARGSLAFVTSMGAFQAPQFASSGAASYAVTLVAGSYGIRWQGNPGLCTGGALPHIPCNSGEVASDAALTESGVHDVNLVAVDVQGAITANGQVPGSETDDRGHLAFALPREASLETEPIGSSGVASYAVTLLAGSYEVLWVGNPELCDGATPPTLPCNRAPVRSEVLLAASGVLDVDVPAVQVRGEVTFGGRPLPTTEEERGAIRFRLLGGQGFDTASLGASGPGAYATTLVRGSYVVTHRPDAGCTSSGAAPLPCAEQLLSRCEARR
jgi:hypothetical protein